MNPTVLPANEEVYVVTECEKDTLLCSIIACINREFALKKVFREKYMFKHNKQLFRADLYIISRKIIFTTCLIDDILNKCDTLPKYSLLIYRYIMPMFMMHNDCYLCVRCFLQRTTMYKDEYITIDGRKYLLTEALDLLEQYEYNEQNRER